MRISLRDVIKPHKKNKHVSATIEKAKFSGAELFVCPDSIFAELTI